MMGNGMDQHSNGTNLRERVRRGGKDVTINGNDEGRRRNAMENKRNNDANYRQRRASRRKTSSAINRRLLPVVAVAFIMVSAATVTFIRYARTNAKDNSVPVQSRNLLDALQNKIDATKLRELETKPNPPEEKENRIQNGNKSETKNKSSENYDYDYSDEMSNSADGIIPLSGGEKQNTTFSLQSQFERDLRERTERGEIHRVPPPSSSSVKAQYRVLDNWLTKLNEDIHSNKAHLGENQTCWIRPYLLPPLDGRDGDDDGVENTHAEGEGQEPDQQRVEEEEDRRRAKKNKRRLRARMIEQHERDQRFFVMDRENEEPMAWEHEWNQMDESIKTRGPAVDYTDPKLYAYPPLRTEPPPDLPGIDYPLLKPLGELFENWPQDEDFDFTAKEGETEPRVIHEQLMHFNFSIPEQMEAAVKFRDAHLPFKVTNVPDLIAANAKWTDEYLVTGFDKEPPSPQHKVRGHAQESPNSYFAFFNAKKWDVLTMGVPPSRNNDWTFERWNKHSRYADAVRLPPNRPHFYWQSGVNQNERTLPKEKWSFVSNDLPSFSSPDATFFCFHLGEQNGIQCRFGERGVAAATHYDGGQNMVGMITGAKRYILSPPNEIPNLGIFTSRKSSIYRHSLLNLGHTRFLSPSSPHSAAGMSEKERAWLDRAATAKSVETVLKSGEVLFIPSFWFHYIISLQKSAQCNVRSGVDSEGTKQFGNRTSVDGRYSSYPKK